MYDSITTGNALYFAYFDKQKICCHTVLNFWPNFSESQIFNKDLQIAIFLMQIELSVIACDVLILPGNLGVSISIIYEYVNVYNLMMISTDRIIKLYCVCYWINYRINVEINKSY